MSVLEVLIVMLLPPAGQNAGPERDQEEKATSTLVGTRTVKAGTARPTEEFRDVKLWEDQPLGD